MKIIKKIGIVIVVAAFAVLYTAYQRDEYKIKLQEKTIADWQGHNDWSLQQHIATTARDRRTIAALQQSLTNASK